MKDIAPDLVDRINSGSIEAFLLFRIGPNANNLEIRYTTLPYNYVHQLDGRTYEADHRLTGLDPPRTSNLLDRSSFKVTLADNDGVLRTGLDNWKMQGAPFVLYAGMINNTSATIGTTLPGRPFDDTLISYEGTVDTYSYSVTPDEEIILTVEGASPMGVLDLTRTLITTKSYLNAKFPGDTSYDQVMEGSNQLLLKWGKI